MPKGDVDYIIRRLRRMTEKSHNLKAKNPRLALDGLPTSSQVKELKEIVAELVRQHKIVLDLATARGPRVRGGPIKTGKVKKVYRTNADTISLNVEQFGGVFIP